MSSYYGPICDSKNNLSCVNYTDYTFCEPTTTLNIQELAQSGGENPAQNNYCFNDLTECKHNIVQKNFYCENNSLKVSSKMSG